MKTNDVLGGLIMLIVVVFVFVVIKSIFSGVIKDLKGGLSQSSGQTLNQALNSPQQGATSVPAATNTTEGRCSNAVINGLLVKNSKRYDSTVGMNGKLQGGIYGILRCINNSISQSYSDPVLVGVFPLLSGKDLNGGVYKNPQAPLMVTNCTGALPICYTMSVPPGTYSVLVDRGQGWYCDSGVCKVDVDSAMTTTFDMITDK